LKTRLSILASILLLISCAPQPTSAPSLTSTALRQTSLPSTASEAYDVLINFLTRLHTRNYADAVPLYGGEYEQLQVFNPEIDPSDHIALWTWACDHQLLQCLEVHSATFKELRGDSYIFQVEFSNPDGSLFVLGPCCGANKTEMPPVSQFEFTVGRNADHRFVVMNTPPYMP
jgi:hypothetical protein